MILTASRRERHRARSPCSLLGAHFLDVVRGPGDAARQRPRRRPGATDRGAPGTATGARRWPRCGSRSCRRSCSSCSRCSARRSSPRRRRSSSSTATSGSQAGLTVLLLAPELYLPVRSARRAVPRQPDGLAAAGAALRGRSTRPRRRGAGASPRRAPDPARRARRSLSEVALSLPRAGASRCCGRRHAARAGRDCRAGGPGGGGEEHARRAAAAAARPGRRAACSAAATDLRATSPGATGGGGWPGCRSGRRCFAGTLADNVRLGAPGRDRRDGRRGARRGRRSTRLRRALPDGLDEGRRRRPGAVGRARRARLRSPGRSARIGRCWCWTSRRRTWIGHRRGGTPRRAPRLPRAHRAGGRPPTRARAPRRPRRECSTRGRRPRRTGGGGRMTRRRQGPGERAGRCGATTRPPRSRRAAGTGAVGAGVALLPCRAT